MKKSVLDSVEGRYLYPSKPSLSCFVCPRAFWSLEFSHIRRSSVLFWYITNRPGKTLCQKHLVALVCFRKDSSGEHIGTWTTFGRGARRQRRTYMGTFGSLTRKTERYNEEKLMGGAAEVFIAHLSTTVVAVVCCCLGCFRSSHSRTNIAHILLSFDTSQTRFGKTRRQKHVELGKWFWRAETKLQKTCPFAFFFRVTTQKCDEGNCAWAATIMRTDTRHFEKNSPPHIPGIVFVFDVEKEEWVTRRARFELFEGFIYPFSPSHVVSRAWFRSSTLLKNTPSHDAKHKWHKRMRYPPTVFQVDFRSWRGAQQAVFAVLL